MTDVRELLHEYLLETLPADEIARVEAALASDPRLQAECARLREEVASLAFLTPAAQAPSPALRDRLLGRVRGADRFLPFVDKLARLFDVDSARAQSYLDDIDDPDRWTQLTPAISNRDVEGGPRVSGQRVGLVRVAAGHEFPPHVHRGTERVLVLQGATRDGERVLRPGDTLEKPDQSRHSTPAVGDVELIYAVVVPYIEVDGLESPS